jgi:hypothetical protein
MNATCCRKQFEQMRCYFDKTAVDLSEEILSCTVQSRLDILKDFYTKDKQELSQIFTSFQESIEKDISTVSSKNINY